MNFDIIGLLETWVEEKNWKNVERKLPQNYRWKVQYATRENKKGRAKGGIITGVRKEIQEIDTFRKVQGIQEREVSIGKEKWRIVTVYNNIGMQNIKNKLVEYIEETEECNLVIGGDFNARVGEQGGYEEETQMLNERRPTKDKTENRDGKKLVELIEERGWNILNGNMTGDKEGEYTYLGTRGNTVIDYVLTNAKARDKVRKFEVGERTDTEHQPIIVTLQDEIERKTEKEIISIKDWSKTGIKKYREYMNKNTYNTFKEQALEKEIEELITKIREATQKKQFYLHNKTGRNNWWDKECRKKKDQVKMTLKLWRQGIKDITEYMRERKKYRELIKFKKECMKKKEELEIQNIKTDAEAWKYINKERKKKREIDGNISIEEWEKHFIHILKGTKEKPLKEETMIEEQEIDEITEEQLNVQIGKLKKNKAAGVDDVGNEEWIYGTQDSKKKLLGIINKIWKGKGFPEIWRKGKIIPIFKAGEKDDVKNYRGITLLNTAYKIYAMIIEEKLKEETEIWDIIPDNQAGFRKGRGTIDNIYVLNYAIGRELAKEGGKLFTFFADLKAAFDTVDRKELFKMLARKGVSDRLINRIKEIYAETKNQVKVGQKSTEEFWTTQGLRQGCPLSPILFSIYVSDLEEHLQREQTGGLVVGNTKFISLAYADDIVILAKTEEEMKALLKSFRRYLEKKKLYLNTHKSKIMVCMKRGGREKGDNWSWGGEHIEQVKKYVYLGYQLKSTGGPEAHIEMLRKKAMVALPQVWGIGERRFGEDLRIRILLFNSIIKSIMMYGAEIWGWEDQEKLEIVQNKYIKWILGLNRSTPAYIALEEMKIDDIKIEATKRAIKFEENVRRHPKKKLLNECWGEIEKKEEQRKKLSKWEVKRKRRYESVGFSMKEISRKRLGGQVVIDEVRERMKDIQGQERNEKIEESRYNNKYKKTWSSQIPQYLRTKGSRQKKTTIARFRCGNEERDNEFWRKDEERVCRMCGEARETVEHMLQECGEINARGGTREDVLTDTGAGWTWMKEVQKRRAYIQRKP